MKKKMKIELENYVVFKWTEIVKNNNWFSLLILGKENKSKEFSAIYEVRMQIEEEIDWDFIKLKIPKSLNLSKDPFNLKREVCSVVGRGDDQYTIETYWTKTTKKVDSKEDVEVFLEALKELNEIDVLSCEKIR